MQVLVSIGVMKPAYTFSVAPSILYDYSKNVLLYFRISDFDIQKFT